MIPRFVLLRMVAMGNSSVKLRNHWRFMTLLTSAACEWLLIFMLFVDATLSYLLTKFAHYCNLQTPCLLCSRIEHVFGINKHGYYWSLLCCNHREEISSLVYCHNHCKLADVHTTCEDCLMSFARRSKSNSETCRFLVAKLGVDTDESGLKSLLLNKSVVSDSSGPRTCSCCNKILRVKSNAQRLLEVTPVGYGASKANVKPPLPRVPGRSRFSRRDSLKRLRDKFSGPLAPCPGGSTCVDSLSHVGYTELKITSDSESEVPFSDDDDATSTSHGNNNFGAESNTQLVTRKLPKAVARDLIPVNQNCQTPEPLPSLLDQPVHLESSEANHVGHLESGGFMKHGLEELNWIQSNPKPTSSTALPELISLDDIPQSVEKDKPIAAFPQPSDLSILSELLSLNSVLSSSNVVKISEKCKWKLSLCVCVCVCGRGCAHALVCLCTSVDGAAEATGCSVNGNSSLAKHKIGAGFTDDCNPTMSKNVNSANKSASTNKQKMEPDVLAEPHTTNDSGRVEEALRSPSRISSSNMDLSPKDTSPRAHCDALPKSDGLGSDAIDMVQMAAALERHDSDHESLDGISVKEIEGETLLERLKRQVDYDRRCMKALFKELEEERNAAGIAANQTMAMITRLQEEKAALHMEALQYLRMMEEQAEYDMEALEKANDLLAEREKEVQDLEAEVEMYRNNILEGLEIDDHHKEASNAKAESKTGEKYHLLPVENSHIATDDSKSANALKGSDKPKQLSNSELDFEDEKLYISLCLQKLEKKFHQISSNGVHINLANGKYAEHATKRVDDDEELPCDTQTQISHQKGECALSLYKDLCAPNGISGGDVSAKLVQEKQLLCEESDYLDVIQENLSANGGVRKLDTFESEIIDLKSRLEALEMDRDIIKHALNSLRNGNDGLQFIQEIAYQLQELRKIEFKKRCPSIP